MKALRLLVTIAAMVIFENAHSQQFTFTFINPSFGGSPLNASWLLQSAQAQSDYNKSTSTLSTSSSAMDSFTSNLNNQILYSLANAIVEKQFGLNSSLKTGQYTVGQYRITIGSGTNGLTVTIFDNTNGNQTQVTIPNQQ